MNKNINNLEELLATLKKVVDNETFYSKRDLGKSLGRPDLRAVQLVLFSKNILFHDENNKIVWNKKIPVTFKLAETLYNDYCNKIKNLPGRKKEYKEPILTKEVEVGDSEEEDILSSGELNWTLKECKDCMKYTIGAMIITILACAATVIIALL